MHDDACTFAIGTSIGRDISDSTLIHKSEVSKVIQNVAQKLQDRRR